MIEMVNLAAMVVAVLLLSVAQATRHRPLRLLLRLGAIGVVLGTVGLGAVVLSLTQDPEAEMAARRAEASITRLVAWNADGGVPDRDGSDAERWPYIQRHLQELPAADVYAFAELRPGWFDQVEVAMEVWNEGPYATVRSTYGDAVRQMILWDAQRFTQDAAKTAQVNARIEKALGLRGGHARRRAPLVAWLRDGRRGEDLVVAHVHLKAGSDGDARALREREIGALLGALPDGVPVVIAGDFNALCGVGANGLEGCDDVPGRLVDAGFTWVRPPTLTPTYCNERYDSVLDMVWVRGGGATPPAATVLHGEPAAFCEERTGHVSVVARIGD